MVVLKWPAAIGSTVEYPARFSDVKSQKFALLIYSRLGLPTFKERLLIIQKYKLVVATKSATH